MSDPGKFFEELGDTNENEESTKRQESSSVGVAATQMALDLLTTSDGATTERATGISKVIADWNTGPEELIKKCFFIGNTVAAVDLCLTAGRFSEALLLASSCGDAELWQATKDEYVQIQGDKFLQEANFVLKHSLGDLVETGNLSHWEELLVMLCTYANSEEFSFHCETLGSRLEKEKFDLRAALICYLCAANFSATAHIWSNMTSIRGCVQNELQILIENLSVVRAATNFTGPDDLFTMKVTKFAEILANSGRVTAAMRYLCLPGMESGSGSTSVQAAMLRHRIFNASPDAMREALVPRPQEPFISYDLQPSPELMSVTPHHTGFNQQQMTTSHERVNMTTGQMMRHGGDVPTYPVQNKSSFTGNLPRQIMDTRGPIGSSFYPQNAPPPNFIATTVNQNPPEQRLYHRQYGSAAIQSSIMADQLHKHPQVMAPPLPGSAFQAPPSMSDPSAGNAGGFSGGPHTNHPPPFLPGAAEHSTVRYAAPHASVPPAVTSNVGFPGHRGSLSSQSHGHVAAVARFSGTQDISGGGIPGKHYNSPHPGGQHQQQRQTDRPGIPIQATKISSPIQTYNGPIGGTQFTPNVAPPMPGSSIVGRTAPTAAALHLARPGMPIPWPIPTNTQQIASASTTTATVNQRIQEAHAGQTLEGPPMIAGDLDVVKRILNQAAIMSCQTDANPKKLDDQRRRLQELYEKLAEGRVSIELQNLVLNFSRAFEAADIVSATRIQLEMANSSGWALHKNWLMGLKRLLPK